MATVKMTFPERLEKAKADEDAQIEKLRRYLNPIGVGKIRHLFETPDHPNIMGVYASNGWSADDFKFGYIIPGKGANLNLSTIAAKRTLGKRGIPTDLHAFGLYIDRFLPSPLRANRSLWQQMVFVRKADMILKEVVVRNNLFGNALLTYNDPKKHRVVCGQQLPEGLLPFAEFAEPLSSPTTKAKVGHDLPVTVESVEAEEPGLLDDGVRVMRTLQGYLYEDRLGRCIDGKFEFGRDRVTGQRILCDEISPDSLRLCEYDAYQALKPGEVPAEFFDKEYGREVARREIGTKRRNPLNKADVQAVLAWRPEEAFVTEFVRRYNEGFRILSRGHSIKSYKRDVLGLY